MKEHSLADSKHALLADLEEWLNCELGQGLLDCERRLLDKRLPVLFGYHLMQLSISRQVSLFEQSVIRHKFSLSPLPALSAIQAQGDLESLPIETDSVDVVLLHHVLEYSDEPHRLLREAARVMMPRGHLLITGFNPWSLFGLRSRLGRRLGSRPVWRSHLLSARRITDWLRLLGFAIEDVRYGFFAPPINRASVLRRFQAIDRLGTRVSLPIGAVYQIHACKEVIPITAIKPHWERRRASLGVVGLAKPSARNTTQR